MLNTLQASDAARIREYLLDNQFLEEAVLERLGTRIPVPVQHVEFEDILSRVSGPGAFDCLVRLFVLGRDLALAESPFPDDVSALLQSCGLLTIAADSLRPMALLSPCDGLWVAADLHQQRSSESGFDHVLPLNSPALTLLNFATRQQVGSTLDLCCGMAVHGLSASRYSESVIASDLNARAQMYGEFNAVLNDCSNVQCVTGSLFETVADRKFDLILCNPPFVMSPSSEFIYRDNPMALDGFCRELLHEAPSYLNEGGICQVICEWVEVGNQDWTRRLAAWFTDCGCDLWVLAANRQLPESYSTSWARESAHESSDDQATRQARWNRQFADGDVTAVYGGLIFIRRRQGENWMSFSEISRDPDKVMGDAVLRGFAARDFLQENREDRDMLGQIVRVPASAEVKKQVRWSDSGWQTESAVLSVADGIPVAVGIDENVLMLMSRLTGESTLAEVFSAMAQQHRLDLNNLQKSGLAMIRRLMEQGCLEHVPGK